MSLDRYSFQSRAQDMQGIDAGLQQHMRRVYSIMVSGLIITTAAAWLVANVPALAMIVIGSPLRIVFAFLPLGFAFFGFTHQRMMTLPISKIRNMFYLFSASLGLSMSVFFFAYDSLSITRAFLTTTCMFGAMSLYGHTTKRDLTAMGSFMVMGFMGVIIAGVINMLLGSSLVNFVASCIGVICMLGLTAWETQMIKRNYNENLGAALNERMAYVGALGLYMNFINLLQFMLQFMGQQRNN